MIRRVLLTVVELQSSDPISRVIARSTEGYDVTFEVPEAWTKDIGAGDSIVMDISMHKQRNRSAAEPSNNEEIDKRFMRLLGASE